MGDLRYYRDDHSCVEEVLSLSQAMAVKILKGLTEKGVICLMIKEETQSILLSNE